MLLSTTPKIKNLETKTTNTEEVNKGIFFGYPSRRHSCSQVNIPAPCVTKTISHIEEVESKIQNYLKQFETSLEEWERIASRKDLKEDLTIVTPVKVCKPKDKDITCPELKEKMKTLLSEIIKLIQSLETDRALAELALKQQKSRRKRISMRIDSWSIWKIQELPLAVQKEHEAYMKDTMELRWHLQDKGHQAEYLRKRKNRFEEANAKIEEDIKLMVEGSFLLKTKQEQEHEALKEQYIKKYEVLEKLNKVNVELQESKKEYEHSKLELEKKKVTMEKSIADEQLHMETFKKEIEQLSDLYTHYTTSIHDVSVEMKTSEETLIEILKESLSVTSIASDLKKKLDNLKKTYEQLFRKHRKFERQYLDTFNDFYATKRTLDSELSNVIKDYTGISEAYNRVVDENKKISVDMSNMVEKINKSIEKKKEYENEIQSLLRMKKKNSAYLKELYEECYRIGTIFAITKKKTEEMENIIAEVKRKFKGREEFLKKLTRGEVAAGVEIQKRLLSTEENQFTERKKFVHKKILFSIALEEIESPLMEIEEDAIKIRVIHGEHYDMLNDILDRKKKVRVKVEKTRKKLYKKEKISRVALSETVDKRSTVIKQYEGAKTKTVHYNEKIIQMTKELRKMEEQNAKLDRELELLRKQFYDVRLEKERIQTVYDHLAEERSKCYDRLYKEGQMFRKFVDMRQRTLAGLCKKQDDLLKENYRLAQEYQKTQTIYLEEKDAFFNLFTRQLPLYESVSDKKQFCQLQRNLQKEWQKYFKLMVLYSQMRLAHLQKESLESIQKILAVQIRNKQEDIFFIMYLPVDGLEHGVGLKFDSQLST
ncbi:coiled-coil domain-containing protein 178 [Dipodomys spectabilis]|uniref:coiled-coil domain-containing protein 178 n=1 Tax=Dipodomys spectabilis TaxID=105255 RepID=UPI001C547DB0|nr:coiled-coil domain-containing protein 178 [Dipodomys spectabilis]